MAEVILMPRLSDTMTEGVIAAWHKKVGDTVKKGDLLAEIETDKATMELESYQDGVLLHIGTPRGGKLQVNDLLAIFGKADEDISALITSSNAVPVAEKAAEEIPKPTTTESTIAATAASGVDYTKMEEVVLMPRLSDTMTEGVIAGWQKKVGDAVKKGEVLADIETDKATMELESYKDGVLLYQGAHKGDKILVNDLLCIIGQAGMDIDAIVKGLKNHAAAPAVAASPAPASVAAATASPAPIILSSTLSAPAAQVVNEGRIFASPLAKKIAQEKGIDLKYVKGTGENGRITRTDLEQFAQANAGGKANGSSAPVFVPVGTVSFVDTPVSQMRKVIAKRLSESLFTAPHFYLTMKINMDAAYFIK